jgi:hypothetical protein
VTWNHGASGYRNYACRCRTCRDGWAADRRVYRQRRKARRNERILRGRFLPVQPASEATP